jgi:uncharacterized Zn finger protein (UPF0148 family)
MDTNGANCNPDNDWKPPTEAEQKVLMARRERSDKISKRMAQYLLKGKSNFIDNNKRCSYDGSHLWTGFNIRKKIIFKFNLFLGHKMLATTCQVCDTIELQDKQEKIFCIACTEIDCQENVKDNPALSTTAANRTLAESSERQTSPRSREAAGVESQMIPGKFKNKYDV